jgi:hypothetical protein
VQLQVQVLEVEIPLLYQKEEELFVSAMTRSRRAKGQDQYCLTTASPQLS